MAARSRRTQPDNLDPLVDTLSNVVGILVIVIALTQIELGDALARVAGLERSRAAQAVAEEAERPAREEALESRWAALAERKQAAPEDLTRIAAELLAMIETLPEERDVETRTPTELARELAEAREEQAQTEAALETRNDRAERLNLVPPHLVARLPDPQVERGFVSWILVRHGRVFLVDREALYKEGSRAFERVIGPAIARGVRKDEFESAALYLRKHAAGTDGFRWQLRTQPELRVELGWPSPDRGIEPFLLDGHPVLSEWLAARSPKSDFIRFQVWEDSFEAYLVARQAIEAAGFRAGWRARESDQELELRLSFGPPPPREQAVEVD